MSCPCPASVAVNIAAAISVFLEGRTPQPLPEGTGMKRFGRQGVAMPDFIEHWGPGPFHKVGAGLVAQRLHCLRTVAHPRQLPSRIGVPYFQPSDERDGLSDRLRFLVRVPLDTGANERVLVKPKKKPIRITAIEGAAVVEPSTTALEVSQQLCTDHVQTGSVLEVNLPAALRDGRCVRKGC